MIANEGFGLASNPGFLRAASAAEDFAHPWMTVIASREPQVVERLRALLAPFGGEMRTLTNPAEAEFVKCAHNIVNATKISFWNERWLVAQRLGVDLDPIAAIVDHEIDTADISDRAANHVQLREVAHQHEPA
jgi:UDPglucose 6-dehydrogenase